MKNIFFSILLGFCLLVGVNNVSAKAHINLGRVYIDYKVLENGIKPFNNYDGNIENMIQYKNNLFEYMNVQSDEDYIIFIDTGYRIIEGYKWKKNISFEKEPGLYFGSYSNSIKNNQLRINFNAYVKDKNPIINYFYIPYETTSTGTAGQIYKKDNVYFIQKNNGFLSVYFDNNSNNYLAIKENVINKLFHYYESSLDLKFTIDKDLITKGFYDYGFDEVVITDEELKLDLKTYKENDIMFKSNGQNTWENISPEISITTKEKKYSEDNKELLYHSVNINFSIFDTEKYIYQYRTSLNNKDTWSDILNNDYLFKSFSNQTLYVRVIDKEKYIESAENGEELVEDVISSATFTFTGITENEKYILPELIFNVDIPKSCYMIIGSKKEIVCKNLNVKIKNYNDINKYLWEYSTDNKENWLSAYSDDFIINFEKNKSVYFRLLDRANNEYIKEESFTVAGITTAIADIGPYIDFEGTFVKEIFNTEHLFNRKKYYIIKTNIYNYDSNLYDVYYSHKTNEEELYEWEKIEPDELEFNDINSSNKSRYFEVEIYKNLTFYVKITDKSGNYVTSATFTVTALESVTDEESFSNMIKSTFEEFVPSIKEVFKLMTKWFNGLPKILKHFYYFIFIFVLGYLLIRFLI